MQDSCDKFFVYAQPLVNTCRVRFPLYSACNIEKLTVESGYETKLNVQELWKIPGVHLVLAVGNQEQLHSILIHYNYN